MDAESECLRCRIDEVPGVVVSLKAFGERQENIPERELLGVELQPYRSLFCPISVDTCMPPSAKLHPCVGKSGVHPLDFTSLQQPFHLSIPHLYEKGNTFIAV